jgi:3'-5' exoribonuclease
MTNARLDIKALAEGQQVDEVYLLVKKQLASTKGGKPYGMLRLGDASGEIEAKLWDQAPELLAPLSPGQVVRVGGRVQVYNGHTQLVLSALAAEPGADASLFLPKSPCDPGELWEGLARAKQGVADSHLQRLLRAFFGDQEFRRGFERAPAAKAAHHAYVHGLLEHTVSVAGLARLTAGHYAHLDADLLITGALLHDIGKVQELTLGPPLGYTDAGRLEGHLVLGARMLEGRLAKLKGFPPGVAAHLRHMILSHHGTEEFGSPIKPKTPEALALHALDDLDAKTAMVRQIIVGEGQSEARWSNFHRLLERHIYTGPSPWDEEQPLTPASPESEAADAEETEGESAPKSKRCSPTPTLFDSRPPEGND